MRLPLAVRDLVADERIARVGIGNAQQRLGQAHQRHAFLRRQRVFLQQALHEAGAAAGVLAVAQLLGDAVREGMRFGLAGRQARLREQRRQRLGLGAAVGGGDGRAQGRRRGRPSAKCDEGRGQGVGAGGVHGRIDAGDMLNDRLSHEYVFERCVYCTANIYNAVHRLRHEQVARLHQA
jgi:hypothetical protein